MSEEKLSCPVCFSSVVVKRQLSDVEEVLGAPFGGRSQFRVCRLIRSWYAASLKKVLALTSFLSVWSRLPGCDNDPSPLSHWEALVVECMRHVSSLEKQTFHSPRQRNCLCMSGGGIKAGVERTASDLLQHHLRASKPSVVGVCLG